MTISMTPKANDYFYIFLQKTQAYKNPTKTLVHNPSIKNSLTMALPMKIEQ
jgi:hypothetical protein